MCCFAPSQAVLRFAFESECLTDRAGRSRHLHAGMLLEMRNSFLESSKRQVLIYTLHQITLQLPVLFMRCTPQSLVQ